jgi:hypothetical protein
MRAFSLTLLLLGILALFSSSAPVIWTENAVGRFLSERKNGDVKARHLYLSAKEGSVEEADLETRAVKKKNGGKKKSGDKKKSSDKKKGGDEKKPDSKLCTRADGDCGKTKNYQIAAAAAKKKGKTLELNESYLLKFKGPGGIHHQIIVGTVSKNAEGELDFEATMSELLKPEPPENPTFKDYASRFMVKNANIIPSSSISVRQRLTTIIRGANSNSLGRLALNSLTQRLSSRTVSMNLSL